MMNGLHFEGMSCSTQLSMHGAGSEMPYFPVLTNTDRRKKMADLEKGYSSPDDLLNFPWPDKMSNENLSLCQTFDIWWISRTLLSIGRALSEI